MRTKFSVFYGTHSSEFLTLDYPKKEKDRSTLVLLIHGGFFKPVWHLNLMEPLAKAFQKMGYTVANIEYPRVGEGRTASQMIQSVFNAYDFVRALESHIQRCFIVGHSAGGYYAEMLALRGNFLYTEFWADNFIIPTAVIPLAPVSDLLRAQYEGLSDEHDAIERFIKSEKPEGSFEEDAKRLSPSSYNTSDCPIYIVHGTHDIDVPLRHSIDFQSTRPFVSLHRIEGNHYDVIEPSHEMLRLFEDIMTQT
jgi:acetyl esterase/lipase